MNSLIIFTPNFTVRNLKHSDLEVFYSYRKLDIVAQYQGFEPMNKLECDAFISNQLNLTFGKAGEWVQYGIEDLFTKCIVGDCAIKLDANDTRIAEIGITIHPKHQSQGIASEIMNSILDILFTQYKIHRVVEIVDVKNIASIKLLEKVGFKREGHFIENIFFKGAWSSEYQYAMLASEWKK